MGIAARPVGHLLKAAGDQGRYSMPRSRGADPTEVRHLVGHADRLRREIGYATVQEKVEILRSAIQDDFTAGLSVNL
jgi:hypothetical protein